MSAPENPPAFPQHVVPAYRQVPEIWGMSLRDWFAGQALSGQLAFSPSDAFEKVHFEKDVAELCYRFADAMLAARQPSNQEGEA